ncbi:MAG: AI-2E family transporter [Natronincolaceae bacterium]|nr:AI-2E family transporter [Bacillota bacterium]NLK91153.1 AI-2E family transporter [Clostridiales bacterium]
MEKENAIQAISKNFKNLAERGILTGIIRITTQFLIVVLLFLVIYFLIHIGNRFIGSDKKINVGKRQIVYFLSLFIFLTLIVVIMQSGGLIYEILSPFIFAIILAYLLNPLVTYIETKGIKKLWAIFIVYFAIGLVTLVFSVTLFPRLTLEIKKLLNDLPQIGNNCYNYIYRIYERYNRSVQNLPDEFDGIKKAFQPDILNVDRVENFIIQGISTVTDFLLSMFSRIVNIILIPILAFYFLKDADKFRNMLVSTIPKPRRREAIDIANDVNGVLSGFIRGQLIVAVLVGILTTISLLILKVEFAVVIGMIAGLTDIIPYFGPIIGIIPAIVFASLGGTKKVLWVILVFVAIQQVMSGIVSPKIVGQNVGLHPIIIILSLIVAGKFFGIFGLLVAVPVVGIIRVIGKHLMGHITSLWDGMK